MQRIWNAESCTCWRENVKICIWVESNVQQARHVEEEDARCVRDVCDARFVRAVAEENCIFAKSRISEMLSTLNSSDWLRKWEPEQWNRVLEH